MYVCMYVQAGRGEVLVKNLRSGQQRAVTFSACGEAVREAIDGTGIGSASGSEEQTAGSG